MIAVPGDSLDIILRHAPAGGVPHPEVFLRFVVALRSGCPLRATTPVRRPC